MNSSQLKDLLVAILKGLVIYPEAIDVKQSNDEMGVLYLVNVHRDDVGKVIGKQGKIADAIRTILRSAGQGSDIRASMKIDVPEKSN